MDPFVKLPPHEHAPVQLSYRIQTIQTYVVVHICIGNMNRKHEDLSVADTWAKENIHFICICFIRVICIYKSFTMTKNDIISYTIRRLTTNRSNYQIQSILTSSTSQVPNFQSPIVATRHNFRSFTQKLSCHYFSGMSSKCMLKQKIAKWGFIHCITETTAEIIRAFWMLLLYFFKIYRAQSSFHYWHRIASITFGEKQMLRLPPKF